MATVADEIRRNVFFGIKQNYRKLEQCVMHILGNKYRLYEIGILKIEMRNGSNVMFY